MAESFNFRVGKTIACNIIRETCKGIWLALHQIYLKPPAKEEDWKKIANDFFTEWNFPNCLGALDEKHVAIECPGYSGSEYYNYKGFFSIVLMSVYDANYCFTLVDVGNYGEDNDAHIFNESDIGKAFVANEMIIPPPTWFGKYYLPYVIVPDEIFALKRWLMKAYPGKNRLDESKLFLITD